MSSSPSTTGFCIHTYCGLCWSKIFTPNSFNAVQFLPLEINMSNFESWKFESFKQDSFRDINQTVLSDYVPQFTKHIGMPLKLAVGQLTCGFVNTIHLAEGQQNMGGHTEMWSVFKDLFIPVASRKKKIKNIRAFPGRFLFPITKK